MRIESIETLLVGDWPLVRIRTDTGLSGVGEGTFWAQPAATTVVVESFKPYLIGQDPLTIDRHWQYLYRSSSFRGASISAALSAIDVALWDIAGKHYGAPVYSLLGGRHRDRIRMCALCPADTVEVAASSTAAAVAEGHTAVKITPIPPGFSQLSQTRLMRETVARVAAVRDAVGPDVDIGVEIHRNMSPGQAVMLAQKLEPFGILFMEDPIQPDSGRSMAESGSTRCSSSGSCWSFRRPGTSSLTSACTAASPSARRLPASRRPTTPRCRPTTREARCCWPRTSSSAPPSQISWCWSTAWTSGTISRHRYPCSWTATSRCPMRRGSVWSSTTKRLPDTRIPSARSGHPCAPTDRWVSCSRQVIGQAF